MNAFTASFLVGIISFMVYKSDICFHVYNIFASQQQFITHHYDGDNKPNSFLLASINLPDAEENFDKVSMELTNAFKTVGFAYLIDTKNAFDPDELLKWTKWFFDLPLEDKMKCAKKAFHSENANVFRGYFPLVPGGHSYKEAFETGIFEQNKLSEFQANESDIRNLTLSPDGRLYMRNVVEEKNVWPITEKMNNDREFHRVMKKYYNFYKDTAKLLFQLLMHGLGLNKNKFDHLFGPRTLTTFRLIHYPTRLHDKKSIPIEAWDGEQAIVTGEHFDSTMITVLATFTYPGLQIKPFGFNDWIDVPADKNKLVVNIGALLSHMAGGKLIATNHRVIDVGVDRYSVPMFYEPCYDGDISKTFFGEKNSFVGKYLKYGPWMTNRTSMFVEYATTDFGIAD